VRAVLGYELKDHPGLSAVIDGRLRALAAVDDLVMRSDGGESNIEDVLRAEFVAYGFDRVSLDGDAVRVPANLTISLALIFHELATNAAKYGGLSTPSGRIHISWRRIETRIALAWRETGGRSVAEPSRWGFGKRLLERGLDPFHGTVEMRFEPAGFACDIAFALGEPDSSDMRKKHQPVLQAQPQR
jgi:two-component sensor histidine kinase